MPEVTDPELLKQLEDVEPGEVTDPELLKQLGGNEDNSVGGYLRSIGKGIKNTLTNYALAPGYAEAGVMNSTRIPGTTEEMKDVANPAEVNAARGPSEHPFVENLAGAAADPMSWLGPGGMASKAIGIGATTLGAEAGRHAAQGSAFEIPAELAGGLAAGHLALGAPRLAAPGKNVTAERQALIDTLKNDPYGGVTSLTAGQKRGSKGLKYAESITADAPLSGTSAEDINEAQKHEFMANLLTRAGVKNVDPKTAAATSDVVKKRFDEMADTLNKAGSKINVDFTKKFGDEFSQIGEDLTKEGLADAQHSRIRQNMENIRNAFVTSTPKATPGQRGNLNRPINPQTLADMKASAGKGVPTGFADALAQGIGDVNAMPSSGKSQMPGKAYQMLTRKNSPLDRLINSENPDERYYGGRLREALDDALYDSAHKRGTREGVGMRQAAQDIIDTRRNWRMMVMIANGVAGAGEDAAKGLMSPAQLRAQMAATGKDKLLYAKGGGMKGLARFSKAANALMSPLPNSGTSQREQAREMFNLAGALKGAEVPAGAGIGAAFGGIPGAIAGAISGPFATGAAGRIIHSGPAQKFLANELPGQRYIAEHRPGASPAWLTMMNILRNQPEGTQ